MPPRRTRPKDGLAPPAPIDPAGDAGFSEAYLVLRDRLLKTKKTSSSAGDGLLADAVSLNEKTLRTVWYEGRFERRGLRTVDGRRVGLVTPGEWNLDEGPDFRGAEIRLEDRLVRGDVEIHLLDKGWKSHGHHEDPHYDNVVLHVVLQTSRVPAPAVTRRGMAVPTVVLGDRLPHPWLEVVQKFDAAGYPFNSHCGLGDCGRKVHLAKYDLLRHLLSCAGDGRVLLKAGSLGPVDGTSSLADVFYRRLLESAGYHRNKRGMLALAGRLRWKTLKDAVSSAGPSRRALLEALLFSFSGLLPETAPASDPETADLLRGMLSLRERVEPALPRELVSPDRESNDSGAWVFRGVRPHNFPCRRVSGTAALLDRFFARLRETPQEDVALLDFGRAGPDAFFVAGEGYFGRRAVWGGKKFRHPAALIGEDRAQAMWVNVYLPLALRVARRRGDAKLEKELHARYHRLRLSEPNGAARLMAHRLFGAERVRRFRLNGEFEQQGLLQIFQDFCDTKPWACRHCVFPQTLDMSLAEMEHGR
ncbi:MAG TPA: DUF2851 family protein [Elusimicrobiota bacterium]|nr:DUF2851 family protein [Elusimicrobiota bacterium]